MILLSLGGLLRANVRLSLPSEGAYRPGACMPVRIEFDSPPAEPVMLTADGIVHTVVESPAASGVIVPVATLSAVAELRCNGTPTHMPLNAVSSEDRRFAQMLVKSNEMAPMNLDDPASKRVVTLAGLLCLLGFSAAALLRTRASAIVSIGIAVVACAMIGLWRLSLPFARVMLLDGDRKVYQWRDAEVLELPPGECPMFPDIATAQSFASQIVIRGNQPARFRIHASRGMRLLTRTIDPRVLSSPVSSLPASSGR